MDGPATLGALRRRHRDRVGEILRATSVFREDEVAVALELFDEGIPEEALGSRPSALGRGEVAESREPRAESYEFLGAFDAESHLTGYACFGPTPATDRTWDLYWIAVDPAAQGSGAGTLLLAEVERRLVARRARMLVVETSSRSEYAPTRGFYARRGYDEAARVRGFYAPGDDRVILTKRLHAPVGAE
ncbi:MAG TPA: GNAT family N-acetyltransferase [Gemmatimonadaceae bacterium]|nr:GNAT family N-acetyltransferase [Gemmatimonadaceae bacterium]